MTRAVFYLRNLNGTNGFAINGINSGDHLGVVSWVGDVNGDGIVDAILGAPNANGNTGQSYIIFGSKEGFAAEIYASNLNGLNGFTINGANPGDVSGSAVSGGGDVNKDGYYDIMIGAPGYQGYGIGYTIFGQSNFSAQFNITKINPTNGILNYINYPIAAGTAVGTANDFNGDGIDDYMVNGLQVYNPGANGYGDNYIIFGSRTGLNSSYNLLNLNGINGFGIGGRYYNCDLGSFIKNAGDINNDGLPDVIIASNCNNQEAYVIFGSVISYGSFISVNDFNGSNGFIITGKDNGPMSVVSGSGDINGDGIDDIVIGAPNALNKAGQIYIIFGSNVLFPAQLDVSTLDGINGFVLNGDLQGDNAGTSVSGIGDFNGDSLADFIVSAPNALSGTGCSYVIFGNNNFPSQLNVTSLNGSNGFTVIGISNNDHSGFLVAGVGDINNDSLPDIIIGAPNAYNNAGQAYVILGSNDFASQLEQLV